MFEAIGESFVNQNNNVANKIVNIHKIFFELINPKIPDIINSTAFIKNIY